VTPTNGFQWTEEVAGARARIANARELLVQIRDEPVPADPNQRTALVANNMELARKETYAFHLWDENDPRFAKEQEIPRFRADGSIHPQDEPRLSGALGGEPRFDAATPLHTRPSAGHHMETILYRLPKDQVKRLDYRLIEQAIAGTEQVSRNLSYRESRSHMPAVDGSIGKLDEVERLLEQAYAGRKGGLAGAWGGLPGGGKAAIAGAGLALGGGLVYAGVRTAN